MENSKKKRKRKRTKDIREVDTLPENRELRYEDITHIVEYLVRTKSRNYTFDCWTEDDIAQEIRIICFKALAHFDVSRVKEDKWQNFFGRCVDNGLKNLKRDNYIRPTPACKGDCGLLHGEKEDEQLLGKVCKKYLRHQNNTRRKIKILHPVPIDVIGENIKDSAMEKALEIKDLERFLLEKIPEKFKEPLVKMLNGLDKEVSKKDKQKVREYVNKILD